MPNEGSFEASLKRSNEIKADLERNPQSYRMLTGDRPTGRLHLGHYFGTIRERVRLQAVADLAALAGAEQSATAGWEDVGERPCGAAFAVAEANGVGVQSCEVRDLDCLVILTQPVRIAGFSTNVSARARAGPER